MQADKKPVKDTPMTKAQFLRKMKKAAALKDMDMRHKRFDELMCRQLIALGYEEAVRVFELADKWYA